MSVIKTQTVEVDGNSFTKQVRYFSSERKFSIEVPAELAEATGTKRIAYETEAEVDQAFNRLLAEFASVKKKEDKVILYRIEFTAKIRDASGRVILNAGQFAEEKKTEISFEYLVATRFRWGGTVEYTNKDGEKVWIGGESVMDWTEERERFFANFKSSMETAILRCNEFFGKNSSKLAKMIDAHAAPLLLGGPQK